MSNFTDSGVLFRNERKNPGDNRPDYQGKINVGGVEKRLAAWIRKGKNGKYMSLKVSDFQQQTDLTAGQQQQAQQGPGERAAEAYRDAAQPAKGNDWPLKRRPESDMDDEVPF